MDGFLGKLDDGAGFDVAVGADMVADAGGGRAESLAIMSVIGVDDADGFADTGVDDEFADTALFFWGKGKVFAGVWTNGPVDVEPHVENTHFDEAVGPFVADHVVDVGFTNAGADACEEFGVKAVLEACHGAGVDFFTAAAFVTDDFAAFHADERGDVAEFAEFLGDFFGDELAVGEDLKVGVGVVAEDLEEFLVHEGFSAEDAEEAVASSFGFVDHFVHGGDVELVLLGFDVYPAALALEVATVDDGNVEEGGEVFALFHPLFVKHDGAGSFDSEVPEEFPYEAFVGLEQNAFGHL